MRILLVCEPGVDGVFRHVEGLSRYLAQKDHELCFAYSSVRDSDGLYFFLDWVERSGFPSIDLATGSFPSLSDAAAAKRLRGVVSACRPEIIHAHSSKAGALVRLFVRPSAPVVYTPHAYYGMRGGAAPLIKVFNSVERLLSRRSTNVHLSAGESDFAQNVLGITPELAVEIPNPVDFDHFKPPESLEKRRALKEHLGIDPDSLVIGTIGRVCYQKNPESLYQAFAELTDVEPRKISLLHVGEGEQKDKEQLQDLAHNLGIANRLIRPEYQSDPHRFYQAMDVFALTSRYEGLPLTALEALATNLPLVVTDAPGLQSFGDYGLSHVFVARKGDQSDLVMKLADSLQPSLDAVDNRERAKKFFSIENCYGRVESLYHQLQTPNA